MKLPDRLNRALTALYLRRKGVVWSGNMPEMNMLRPPHFAVYGRLTLGSGVKFFTHMGPSLIQVDENAIITIGNCVTVGSDVWIRAGSEIVIGDGVGIARNVDIIDDHLHPVNEGDRKSPSRIRLGRNSWIGLKSTILKGVEIGEHSIVGAGSVVIKSVPPRTKVAGDPARIIGTVTCSDDWIRGECEY